jgi:hypothetical protein
MKKTVLFIFLAIATLLTTGNAFSQDLPDLDKSPADIAYYPPKIATDRDAAKTPSIKVVYSRPQKNGRVVFGQLEPFGKVWRAGANESTEIKFYKDVKFGGKDIKAGTYTLYAIPEKDKWTVIINSGLDNGARISTIRKKTWSGLTCRLPKRLKQWRLSRLPSGIRVER